MEEFFFIGKVMPFDKLRALNLSLNLSYSLNGINLL